jgi:hypothetical protein
LRWKKEIENVAEDGGQRTACRKQKMEDCKMIDEQLKVYKFVFIIVEMTEIK